MLSIRKPLPTGAIRPDVENASASIENAAGRRSGAASVPTTCCAVICTYMKPVPSSALATSSGAMSATSYGNSAGSRAPAVISEMPSSSGRNGPAVSSHRPARTASSAGTSAKSAICTPTVKAEALFDSAYSVPVRRAAPNAVCVSTMNTMM